MDLFTTGEITVMTALTLFLLALVMGAVGGAIGGILVGGKDIGNELAAMMGAFFGPVATAPGAVLGLVLLALLQ